jgi:hypothetical protein
LRFFCAEKNTVLHRGCKVLPLISLDIEFPAFRGEEYPTVARTNVPPWLT